MNELDNPSAWASAVARWGIKDALILKALINEVIGDKLINTHNPLVDYHKPLNPFPNEGPICGGQNQ